MPFPTHKKDIELSIVSALLHLRFSGGFGEPEAREAPDWQVSVEGEVVGVEVTLVPNEQLRRVEGMQRKVIAKAKAIAVEEKMPPTFVRVGFTGCTVENANVARLANALAGKVNEVRALRRDDALFVIPGDSPLLPEIDEILVSQSESWHAHDWAVLHANSVKSLSSRFLQTILDQKEAKLASYRAHYDRCWIVIGAEGHNDSSAYSSVELDMSHVYRSSFDRAFYVNPVHSEALELDVVRSV